MKISTHSPRVLKARRTIVELLLANHPDDCLYCDRNGLCGLQDLAGEMNIRERKYHGKRKVIPVDHSCPSIVRDPAKCLLCGRCVRICDEVIGVGAIDVIGRGSESQIGTAYNKGLNPNTCVKCGQCIMVCPTGALTEKSNLQQIIDTLHNPALYPVIQFSPTVPASIGEEFNLKASKDILNLLRAALKRIGFRQIFDTSMAADLTIMEEAAIFAERFEKNENLPMLTSCCPAWVKYVEDVKPQLLPYLSTTLSPQQMMGRLIKNYITSSAGLKPENVFVVSVMPCTAKKSEADRDRMKDGTGRYVDAVLTTREFARLIRLLGIDFGSLEPEPTDTHYGIRSSAGNLFGISGGHLEGLVRTVHQVMTGQEMGSLKIAELRGLKGRKEAKIRIGKNTISVSAISGLAAFKSLAEDIETGKEPARIIELMVCPNGCINGGGQKLNCDEKNLKARMKAIYDVDDEEMIRVAHKNPVIVDLYDRFLAKPASDHNRELLHSSRTTEKDS